MWWAVIIPVLGVAVLLGLRRGRVEWWQPLVVLTPILLIPLLSCIGERSQVSRWEWLTKKCVQVQHYEPWVAEWQEWVQEQGHPDEKGNYHMDSPGHFETRTAHHPERWTKVETNGWAHEVSGAEYQRIKAEWRNEQYHEMQNANQRHRSGCAAHGGFWKTDNHHKCNCADGRGDMFTCSWPGTHETIEAMTVTSMYVNRMQAARESVFRFPEISKERAQQLFRLPEPDGDMNCQCVLGDGGPTQVAADWELRRWNAVLGPREADKFARACHSWVLVFKGSTSDDDSRDQEALWKGGNKNEFTLCIGVDGQYRPTWAYVISWTEAQRLKVDVRDFAIKDTRNPIDLVSVVKYLGQRCEADFVRKRSSEWAYLSVKQPTWCVWLCWVLMIGLTGGAVAFVVSNEDWM